MSLSVIFTLAPIYTSSRKQIPPMNFSEIMLRHLVGWLLINWKICFRFNCNRPEHTISTAINLSNKVTCQPVVQVKKKIFVEDCKAIDGQSTLIVRFKSYLFNASWAVFVYSIWKSSYQFKIVDTMYYYICISKHVYFGYEWAFSVTFICVKRICKCGR